MKDNIEILCEVIEWNANGKDASFKPYLTRIELNKLLHLFQGKPQKIWNGNHHLMQYRRTSTGLFHIWFEYEGKKIPNTRDNKNTALEITD